MKEIVCSKITKKENPHDSSVILRINPNNGSPAKNNPIIVIETEIVLVWPLILLPAICGILKMVHLCMMKLV
jgi:hypothetical protein